MPKQKKSPLLAKTKKGNWFSPLPPQPSSPLAGTTCGLRLPPAAGSPRAPLGSVGAGGVAALLEGLGGAAMVLESAPAARAVQAHRPGGVRPAGRYFGDRTGDKGERDRRCRPQARGKFLFRGKYFQRGFSMAAAGSFLHNPLYFGRKGRRRNALPLLFPPPGGKGGPAVSLPAPSPNRPCQPAARLPPHPGKKIKLYL